VKTVTNTDPSLDGIRRWVSDQLAWERFLSAAAEEQPATEPKAA
jgi:hypothetical protein